MSTDSEFAARLDSARQRVLAALAGMEPAEQMVALAHVTAIIVTLAPPNMRAAAIEVSHRHVRETVAELTRNGVGASRSH